MPGGTLPDRDRGRGDRRAFLAGMGPVRQEVGHRVVGPLGLIGIVEVLGQTAKVEGASLEHAPGPARRFAEIVETSLAELAHEPGEIAGATPRFAAADADDQAVLGAVLEQIRQAVSERRVAVGMRAVRQSDGPICPMVPAGGSFSRRNLHPSRRTRVSRGLSVGMGVSFGGAICHRGPRYPTRKERFSSNRAMIFSGSGGVPS